MKLLQNLKKKLKFIVGIAAAALLISQVVVPALGTNAEGPRFNFLQGDQELFTGLDSTKGETVWKDPISGNAGDTLTGLIYYHNGVLNEPAVNTRVKVTIPAQTTLNSAKLTATISADNAAAVSDTIVDEVIVGKSGLTVNLDKNATLNLIPGTVKWFPNQKENPGTTQPLPGGQTGAELTSEKGLNIGTIDGCWDFAGFVMFQFKTTSKVEPGNLTISKTVRNTSNGETNFVESVNADQSETVEFNVDITNSGQTTLQDVVASDQIPAKLTAKSGTLKLIKNGNTSIINEAAFFAGGVNIGDLTPGATNKAQIRFQATAPAEIRVGETVVNWAKAVSGSISVRDQAQVVLMPGVANIVKSKSAFNKTLNVDATSRAARSNDVIEYTLNTKNTGTISKDFVIEDGIADVLELSDIVSISDGGTIISGTEGTNDAKIVKWASVAINPGETIARKFTVKVISPLPANARDGFHFDDKMFNTYGNDVVISIERPHVAPVLTIDKLVRNVTRNELEYVKSNTALPGDMLEYKISFANTGNGPADRVTISDVLPANVSLDTTAAAVINLDGTEHSITEDITKGFLIDTIPAGASGYVRFRATIATKIAAGEKLVNTGFIEDNGVTIKSEANTTILTQIVLTKTPTELPKTGAAVGIISIFGSLFTGANLMYFKQKRMLKAAARSIVAN